MIKLLLSLLLCAFAASPYAASNDDFGRLFSHASERNYLEKLRQKQKLKTDTLQVTPALISPTLPGPISLHGYVKRNDGKKSTLWINRQAVQEESTLGNLYIGRLNQRRTTSGANLVTEGVDVTVSSNAQPIRLQAGQRYTHETKEIEALSAKENSKSLDLADTDAIIAHDKKSTQ
jgi:hypothetical protein